MVKEVFLEANRTVQICSWKRNGQLVVVIIVQGRGIHIVAMKVMTLHATSVVISHKLWARISTKQDAGLSPLKWGPEPSLIGEARGMILLDRLHWHNKLKAILGMEVLTIRDTTHAPHIDPVPDRCHSSTTNTIQERTIVANTKCFPLLLTTERDLDN